MAKRLIEDLLPLGELNKYAQKGGGIGSLNAMHPYFARRPLTASRAMTLAALMERAAVSCGPWRRPWWSCCPRTTPSARR